LPPADLAPLPPAVAFPSARGDGGSALPARPRPEHPAQAGLVAGPAGRLRQGRGFGPEPVLAVVAHDHPARGGADLAHGPARDLEASEGLVAVGVLQGSPFRGAWPTPGPAGIYPVEARRSGGAGPPAAGPWQPEATCHGPDGSTAE